MLAGENQEARLEIRVGSFSQHAGSIRIGIGVRDFDHSPNALNRGLGLRYQGNANDTEDGRHDEKFLRHELPPENQL